MLVFVHVLNILSEDNKPLSKLVKPLQRYAASGERNFENEDKEGTMRALAEQHVEGNVDFLDGVTVAYEDWWFNVRPSNTEPLLRLNIEAKNKQLLQKNLELLL